MLLTLMAGGHGAIQGILISFLVVILILCCVGALIWAIDKYISPIPGPIKTIIAVVCVILIVIWALNQFV